MFFQLHLAGFYSPDNMQPITFLNIIIKAFRKYCVKVLTHNTRDRITLHNTEQ